MKRTLLSFLLLFAATAMNAQTIVMGDMNDDKELTITDAVSVVDVVLGKSPKREISLVGDPYLVDNTLVVGTWYAPDGTSFTLNEDGTTDFSGAATYKFRPNLGTLLFFNASGNPVKKIVVDEVEKGSYLLTVNSSTNAYTYYTNQSSLATGITLDQTSLAMNSGTTAQLTASITPADAFASISWTSSDESVATVDANGLVTAVAGGTCTITATTSGSGKTATCSVTVTQMVTSIVLSQTAVVLNLDEFVRLTAIVLPANAANKNVVWSSSNENVAPVKGGRVDAYDYGTAVITCEAADGSGVKATCTIYIIDPSTYVDLGLPSGTLWATCNIGATNPEDYGDYFAWGETSAKATYDWSTYFDTDDNGNTFKKYNNNGGLTELELADDAAYVNWGAAWCMPSKEQFDELINNSYTTTEWTEQNGVYGRKITSKKEGYTDNFIFLPAAGHRDDTSLYWDAGSVGLAGSYCLYWSRTLNESDGYASHLLLTSSGIGRVNPRYLGQSVRPVRFSE